MTNGDQVQGGGGQRTYSEEDVLALMNETAKRAATEATKIAETARIADTNRIAETNRATEAMRHAQNENEDDNASVINPKVVRQLKDTVAVFTALKDLSSNPLQKTIEETVGGMAASVVQSAFSPRGPPPKQDIVDKLLNSQFAYGLGSGLGQRAPELVETMGRTFGTEKAGQMMDNIIGKYGTAGSPPRQVSGPSAPSPQSVPEQKDKQSEKELLLSLDPNNSEHVSAYADTQGGLPVDVARKMLMIHQDAFIEQLKRDGMNIDQISTQRGSRTQPPVTQNTTQPIHPSPMRDDIPIHPDDNYSNSHTEPSPRPHNNIEYSDAEYNDMVSDHNSNIGQQHDQTSDHNPNIGQQHGQTSPGNTEQMEMMKTFATDIGKVMGDMLNKIETLNNTVFTLQNEMNNIKTKGPIQSSIHTEIPSHHINIPDGHAISDTPLLETFDNFFEKDVDDIKQKLEEDTKLSTQARPIRIQPVKVVQSLPDIQLSQSSPDIQKDKDKDKEDNVIDKEGIENKDKDKEDKDKEDSDIEDKDKNKDKEDNIVTPTEQPKLHKDVGIHNKAIYRNVKPSFKKNDDKEN